MVIQVLSQLCASVKRCHPAGSAFSEIPHALNTISGADGSIAIHYHFVMLTDHSGEMVRTMLFELRAPSIIEGEALPTILDVIERDFPSMRHFSSNTRMDAVAPLGLLKPVKCQ
jgi:hypothetical protein